MQSNLTRRSALAGVASVAGMQLLPNTAHAQRIPSNGEMVFKVLRDGKSHIGEHRLKFVNKGNRLLITNALDIDVKVAGFSAFSYKGAVQELWQGQRLIALNSKLRENGKSYAVEARAIGNRLQIKGADGIYDAPGDTLPTSYWNMGVVQKRTLLDPQHGKILRVSSKPVARNRLKIPNQQVAATRFDMNGDVKTSIWYSDAYEWVGMRFVAKGSSISYIRDA